MIIIGILKRLSRIGRADQTGKEGGIDPNPMKVQRISIQTPNLEAPSHNPKVKLLGRDPIWLVLEHQNLSESPPDIQTLLTALLSYPQIQILIRLH
jgi:hypothetical protein